MGTPVQMKITQINHDDLGRIAAWLADGSVGASLSFKINQEGSDFAIARNVTIKIENPTIITMDQLKQLMKASFAETPVFKEN